MDCYNFSNSDEKTLVASIIVSGVFQASEMRGRTDEYVFQNTKSWPCFS